MFDYFEEIDGEFVEYKWTNKLKSFNELLWHHTHFHPDLKKEIEYLSFQSAVYSTNSALTLPEEYPGKVKSVEDAKNIEKYYCENHWDLVAYMAINSIPATLDETEKLLKIIDFCANKCFRDDLSRKERAVKRPSRANEGLGTNSTVEEIEKAHTVELSSGENVAFGHINWQWLELLHFKRDTDELYSYSTSPESWEALAGEAGVALVRDGYVITDIMTAIS